MKGGPDGQAVRAINVKALVNRSGIRYALTCMGDNDTSERRCGVMTAAPAATGNTPSRWGCVTNTAGTTRSINNQNSRAGIPPLYVMRHQHFPARLFVYSCGSQIFRGRIQGPVQFDCRKNKLSLPNRDYRFYVVVLPCDFSA